MGFHKILVILLVVGSIIMQMVGGVMDMRDIPFVGPGITKEHLWSNATFLLLLALFIYKIKV